jgi:hypothetical protein
MTGVEGVREIVPVEDGRHIWCDVDIEPTQEMSEVFREGRV